MSSSACQVLLEEPDRFVDYILSDKRLRSTIYDEESFAKVLETGLKSDPTLRNLTDTVRKENESFEVCGANIFKNTQIQKLIKSNLKSKKENIKKRVAKDRPKLKGKAFDKEVNRRFKISIGVTKKKRYKQISIEEATKPIRINYYNRAGKQINKHRRTNPRALTKQELMLISNSVKKKKLPSQVIQDYYDSGLKFRTKESIRKHYYRIKRKL